MHCRVMHCRGVLVATTFAEVVYTLKRNSLPVQLNLRARCYLYKDDVSFL